ncbi:MAG: hypothetical protein GIX03_05130 [Candidatus Eremiobacteraeota bacterium]|nr:hypothetical protein [Candidatus Eremiobacteraeota bacterium]MBC5802380.1 hypothetical protein [Candidatus Eremiobacteraeota bacterium]MBC5820598.1 hypothetical protein [Candidatus Eremiobacteraeota bacterium]
MSLVAIAFACGAIVARVLLRYAPSRTLLDRAQPLVVVTAWGSFGAGCFWTLAATLALATLILLAAGFAIAPQVADRDRLGPEIAAAAALAIAASYAWPFVFSSDVYAYAAYGAMLLHGHDPYAVVAPHVHGAIIDAARWQWSGRYPVCVYGPGFVGVAAAAVAATSGATVATTLWALRILAAVAFLCSILAVDAGLQSTTPRRRFLALAAYGLNPVALWTVAEGHNDAFVLLLGSAAFALAWRRAAFAGALTVGLSATLKATGALYAIAALIDALRFAGGGRRVRIVTACALGLTCAAVVTVPSMSRAFETVGRTGRYVPTASLQSLIGIAPAMALAVAAAAWGSARLARRDREGYAWLGIALWLAVANVYPWYVLWVLPAIVAAAVPPCAQRRELPWAPIALWAATISAVVRYLPDASGALPASANRWAAAAAVVPLLGALGSVLPPSTKKATPSS